MLPSLMELSTITVPAYAKVNLTLDVLSLRPDGFHGVATVMQNISLADTVTASMSRESGISLECTDATIPTSDDNLAFRAAAALLELAGAPGGINLRLEKRIPSQAGLGGGSADAAATLRAVNDLMKLGLTTAEISRIGAGLGSDVPFFLYGGAAACRGKGELVTPLSDTPRLWFVVVKPELDISTADAYRALDRLPDRISARATRSMEQVLGSGDVERITARMANDFEQVVFADHPALTALQDDLLMARARNARLCGSGSAVFGVAWNRDEAGEIARLMRLKYDRVFVCRSLTRAESLAYGAPIS